MESDLNDHFYFAHVVEKGPNHEVEAFPGPERPRRRLQAVLVPIDLVAELGPLHDLEQTHDVADQLLAGVLGEDGPEKLIVFPGSVGHRGPAHRLHETILN